MLTVAEVT